MYTKMELYMKHSECHICLRLNKSMLQQRLIPTFVNFEVHSYLTDIPVTVL